MSTLSNICLLSRLIGMLTDSRSFLSFPRHEYFRRILCGMLGDQMESGEIPVISSSSAGWYRTSAGTTRRRTLRFLSRDLEGHGILKGTGFQGL
jgi:hypothetical protein